MNVIGVIKGLFERPLDRIEPMVLDIDGYKIMTETQIKDEHKEFGDIVTVVRYLYTKDKERDKGTKIGFIGGSKND